MEEKERLKERLIELVTSINERQTGQGRPEFVEINIQNGLKRCKESVLEVQPSNGDEIEEALGLVAAGRLYEAETAPLLEWYEERRLLVEINGTGSPDAVTRRVVGAVDVHRQNLRGVTE